MSSPAAVNVNPTLGSGLPWDVPTSVIVVWPGDDDAVMDARGQVVRVPPAHEVAVKGRGSRFRFPAAVGKDGKALPGTIVLTNHAERNAETGLVVELFSAVAYAKEVQASQPALFRRGLRFVTDPSQVAQVQAEARAAWDQDQEAADVETLRVEMERRNYWKSRGMPVPAGSNEESVAQAMKRQQRRQVAAPKIQESDILKALGNAQGVAVPAGKGGGEGGGEPEIVPPPAAAAAPQPPDDPMADMAAHLHACAEKANFPLKKAHYQALFLKDPDGLQALEIELETAGVDLSV